MISESTFAAVFGAAVAGGDDSLVHLARAAVRAGFAVVPNLPGTKQPMCTLTSREVNKADAAAQEDARLAGKKRWEKVRHACGIHHAITDPKDSDRILKRLTKDGARVNLGIEPGRSKILVVDVDTAAERAAFEASWRANDPETPIPPYTVASPGVQDGAGTWVHRDGGHYYFALPQKMVDWLAEHEPGAVKVENSSGTGWSAVWKDRQVLVPPSTRREGAYQLVGDVYAPPAWLLRVVISHVKTWTERASAQKERRAAALEAADGSIPAIDQWSAATPWSKLLEADGWTETGDVTTCGCPEWTAPGFHASPKSATAHEEGCGEYDDSPGHCPLYIWTDNPPEPLEGHKAYTKIQYMAAIRHGSTSTAAIRAACREEGIAQEGGAGGPGLNALQAATLGSSLASPAQAQLNGHAVVEQIASTDPLPHGESVEAPDGTDSPVPVLGVFTPIEIPAVSQDTELSEHPLVTEFQKIVQDIPPGLPEQASKILHGQLEFELYKKEAARLIRENEARELMDGPPGSSWQPVDLGPILRGEVVPEAPTVGMARTDGQTLIYPGKEHAVLGEMESGKSWFACACAAAEMAKGHHVVYLHFEESDPTGTVERLLLIGVPPETIQTYFHFIGPEEPVRPEWMIRALAVVPSLVVVDGVNEAMALHGQGIRDEDGAAQFRKHLVKPSTKVGAAVLVCDHVVKDASSRGRYQIGSVHKANAINGASIMIENREPFGKGQRGQSEVYVVKDRPGQIRQHGRPTDTSGKTHMGSLVVDSTEEKTKMLGGKSLVKFSPPHGGAVETQQPLADLPPVHDPGLPSGGMVAEVAAVMRQKYEDNPRDGYTPKEVSQYFKDMVATPGQAGKLERDAVRKSATRAYDRLVRDQFLVPVKEENPTERASGKHRWRGPEDGPRPGSEAAPEEKFPSLGEEKTGPETLDMGLDIS